MLFCKAVFKEFQFMVDNLQQIPANILGNTKYKRIYYCSDMERLIANLEAQVASDSEISGTTVRLYDALFIYD